MHRERMTDSIETDRLVLFPYTENGNLWWERRL